MALSTTLETFLNGHHAAYDLEIHSFALSSLKTARAAHIDEHALAKSVLLEDDEGPVLAVLPASSRLELSQVREKLGRDLHFAEESTTGMFFPDCALGALPPVGPAFGLPTVVDRSLGNAEEVFFEAGDHETLVHMDGQTFRRLLGTSVYAEIASESPAWIASRRSRERLHGSLLALEDAVSAPVVKADRWKRRVQHELTRLRSSLADHVAQSEASGGLLREIEREAPRLVREIAKLRLEHDELEAATGEMLSRMKEPSSPAALRRAVSRLLDRFAAHRRTGADLVFEAYGVDIGGG